MILILLLAALAASDATVATRLRSHVEAVATPEGRGPGSAGLAAAARWTQEQFRAIGLDPALDTPSGNIVATLGGADPKAGCLVIGAHYDHLPSAGDQHFPGADDNASGVAALVEIARSLKESGPLDRTVVLVAFSGEEQGLLGSRAYVNAPARPLAETVAMLNLDTVGRMEDHKLYLLGVSSAAEWPGIVKAVNLAAGLDLVTPEAAPFASDQVPFYEKGIPVLHLFTGPNADYHHPTDTADKVNAAGLAEVVDFASELALFLSERRARLTFAPPAAGSAPQAAAGPPRRVSLGTIPDFKKESGGVLLAGVVPGSPAEALGFVKGDVLVELAGTPIDNLSDLTEVLKAHAPGDTVVVTMLRGAERITKRAGLVERK